MPDRLRLEVTEYTSPSRWRWVLTESKGAFLADHEVRLDPASEDFETFTTLHDRVSRHPVPGRHAADEARLVTRLGDWIGAEVFGPAIGRALVARRPATVEVVLPAGAEPIAYLPLETARVEGRSLAGHDLTLVIQPRPAEPPPAKTPAAAALRVLGLFSLPEGGTILDLRRERQSLVALVNGIAAHGRAATVKVLQYGVTRDRLRDILEDAEGWDIIHLSGHGVPGRLILETAAGNPDPVDAADLADLLDLARDRVKLVTVSACWSAALKDQKPSSSERISVPPSPPSPPPGDIATTLAGRLGCAVLAMRFPVDDEFAIELAGNLYELLAVKGQPLPRAVSLALRRIAEATGRRLPPLALATPALFGSAAATLTLRAPPRTGPVSYATDTLKLAHFPPQPGEFEGRTAVMARASQALAPASGIPAVILCGAPGNGQTDCALELAYTHEDAFDRLVWFQAPAGVAGAGADISGALTDFASALERDLPGFRMTGTLGSEPALTSFLPRLTELLERRRLLIVVDRAESLLTESGAWRDARWGQVFDALTNHNGLGRLILTTRRLPVSEPPRFPLCHLSLFSTPG